MSLYHACPKCGDLVERKSFEPVRPGRLCAACVRAALEPLFVRAARQARLRDLVSLWRRAAWGELTRRVLEVKRCA